MHLTFHFSPPKVLPCITVIPTAFIKNPQNFKGILRKIQITVSTVLLEASLQFAEEEFLNVPPYIQSKLLACRKLTGQRECSTQVILFNASFLCAERFPSYQYSQTVLQPVETCSRIREILYKLMAILPLAPICNSREWNIEPTFSAK